LAAACTVAALLAVLSMAWLSPVRRKARMAFCTGPAGCGGLPLVSCSSLCAGARFSATPPLHKFPHTRYKSIFFSYFGVFK
jgi:hypothetical protein